jgi:hypothetical protein
MLTPVCVAAQQSARAGEEHERRRDLRDRERAQPAAGAGRQAGAAIRETEAVRPLGGRQARDEREEHRRRNRQAHTDPEQARIHRDVQGADRKPRCVAREQRHHRPRQQHAENRAAAA